MELFLLDTGSFKLDGGSMFGVVPKLIWQRLIPPDESNRVSLAMRCLLVKTRDRLILVDTGIGTVSTEKFLEHFVPKDTHLLVENLTRKGFQRDEVTDVILTHLHFDHAGGAVCLNDEGILSPTFPRATYWVSEPQWRTACNPHRKESPSFIRENFIPLEKAGVLRFLPFTGKRLEFTQGFYLHLLLGHTRGMVMPEIYTPSQSLIYGADLIPTHHHLSLSYIIAFDMHPMQTVKERRRVIQEILKKGHVLVFEHDLLMESAILETVGEDKVRAVPTPLVSH